MKLADKFSVQHIRQEGARFHVRSFGLCVGKTGESFATTWCNEPFCRDNLASILDCHNAGLDPARIIPATKAREWLASPAGRAALTEQKP